MVDSVTFHLKGKKRKEQLNPASTRIEKHAAVLPALTLSKCFLKLSLIRRATFSLCLNLPLMPVPLRATLNISFRECKYYINCSQPMFAGRMLQNGAAVSALSITNLPLLSPEARMPHPDRQRSGRAICYN